jgi:hypothetical protein
MSSLAATTRSAVDARPFIRDGLRAGVVNFAAAARYLDVDGGEEAVATALRRYADELPPLEDRDGGLRVTMQSGVGTGDDALLTVGEESFGSDGGSLTAIQAVGDVDAHLLGTIATRLAGADVDPAGVGMTDAALVVLVDRRDASTVLTIVEDAAAGYR